MNERIIGTCSICGGPVVVPAIFYSVIAPTPRCRDCGARMKKSYGRVIPMEQNPYRNHKNCDYIWEYERKGPEDDPQWDDVWGI